MTIELPALIKRIQAKKSLTGNRYAEVYFDEVHNTDYNDATAQHSVWEKVYWKSPTHASGVQHFVGRVCVIKIAISQVQEKRNNITYTILQCTILRISLN